MQPLLYRAETPDKIQQIPVCTPAEIQEYLQLCLQLVPVQPPRNILQFPYDTTVNPYAIFYDWCKQANFQIHPGFTDHELERLQHFAHLPSGKLFKQMLDSTGIYFHDPNDSQNPINPYLQHFSQIYTLNQTFTSMYIYNFLLENYIHESGRLRKAIQENLAAISRTRLGRLHHTWVYESTAAHQYNHWVRNFLLREGVGSGVHTFSTLISHSYQKSYRTHYPVLNPAHRTNAVCTYEDNQKLAHDLRHYRYFHFLQPTIPEQDFIRDLRNEQHSITEFPLLSQDSTILQRAVELSGRLNRCLPLLAEHRSIY